MSNHFQDIYKTLSDAFNPNFLDIVDESEHHSGHYDSDAFQPSHIHVSITSAAFNDKSRVDIHKMIHKVLHPFFKKGLHALKISAKKSEESE